VLSVGEDEVVLVVRHQSVLVPLTYLEIIATRPNKWAVIAQEHYAVCPNCAERVAVGALPEQMRCRRCSGAFEFELRREAIPAH
jgi:hypothetical protein